MPKSNDISLFRIKLFKSFWGLRLFMSGCFGLPRRRLWLIIGSLSLSLSLLFWIGSYITPLKTAKDEVVLQYPSQRFTKKFGPSFWEHVVRFQISSLPIGEAQHDVRSKEEPLLVTPVEFNMEPWNFKWCLEMFGPWYSMIFPYAHMLNQVNMAQTRNMLCSLTPTGITKRVKSMGISRS